MEKKRHAHGALEKVGEKPKQKYQGIPPPPYFVLWVGGRGGGGIKTNVNVNITTSGTLKKAEFTPCPWDLNMTASDFPPKKRFNRLVQKRLKSWHVVWQWTFFPYTLLSFFSHTSHSLRSLYSALFFSSGWGRGARKVASCKHSFQFLFFALLWRTRQSGKPVIHFFQLRKWRSLLDSWK